MKILFAAQVQNNYRMIQELIQYGHSVELLKFRDIINKRGIAYFHKLLLKESEKSDLIIICKGFDKVKHPISYNIVKSIASSKIVVYWMHDAIIGKKENMHAN